MGLQYKSNVRIIRRGHSGTGFLARLLLAALMLALTGCVWLRLYETRTQLAHFDEHFRVEVTDRFRLRFKDPILFSSDFAYLAKLKASRIRPALNGQTWYYTFYKVNGDGLRVDPPISFDFELKFNTEDRLALWTFSPVFLAMMPAEFLEISLRSLGTSKIDQGKRQVRADPDALMKTDALPPTRAQIERSLGLPLQTRRESAALLYVYHFMLNTPEIEEGYEERALSEVKLYFNPDTDRLLRMSGRFAGLKLSIDYGKLLRRTDTTA